MEAVVRGKNKRRLDFKLETYPGEILVMGVLYPEGNVQVSWRKSIGWTAEQYSGIGQVLNCEEGMHRLVFHME